MARRPAVEPGLDGPAIALIDGEHHPAAVRDALDRLERERGLAGVVFCGGQEKLALGPLDEQYGRAVRTDAREALADLAASASALVDLADEPVLPAGEKLRLASLGLHLGLRFESPGALLAPPPYEPVAFGGPKLAVIGTGKRTGKTAVAGHWASLLAARGAEPVIVCMGRGGPAEPLLAEAGTSLEDLLAVVAGGGHGASDYLEDAVLAGVPTIGCRRVGGGLVGEPSESNVLRGAALAASLRPGAILFEGSGACIPPVVVDRTVCVVGPGPAEPFADYRLLRADLILAADGAELPPGFHSVRLELRPEPAEPLPGDARVALFTTGADHCEGVDPLVTSTNLARRGALEADLARARREGCDTYLTELKAAAIDTVAEAARRDRTRIAFVRNRPMGIDEALMAVMPDA